MPSVKPLARFLCFFAVFYGLLIAPWPGWNSAYCHWFRTFNGLVFRSNDRRILRFDLAQGARPPIDTWIILANRDQIRADGSGPAKKLGLDTRGVGWVPTALFAALTLASPMPWRGRIGALLAGLLLVHAFIVFSVGCYIWNQSEDLHLATLTPFWKAIANGLEETLVTQLGASFVVPALIWVLLTAGPQILGDPMDRERKRPRSR